MLCAFTLSETLIALVIIGIVAAITVPNLIVHHQKQETISKLKKVYSALSNAMRLSRIQNDTYDSWPKEAEITNVTDYFNKYYKPFFNHAELITSATDLGYSSEFPWKNLNGNVLGWKLIQTSSRFLFVLNDGTLVFIPIYSKNSATNTIGYANYFYVDINGSKNPNVIGKDVFIFNFDDDGNVVPYCSGESYQRINAGCTKNSSGNTNCCTAKLFADGWEFKSDYPW